MKWKVEQRKRWRKEIGWRNFRRIVIIFCIRSLTYVCRWLMFLFISIKSDLSVFTSCKSCCSNQPLDLSLRQCKLEIKKEAIELFLSENDRITLEVALCFLVLVLCNNEDIFSVLILLWNYFLYALMMTIKYKSSLLSKVTVCSHIVRLAGYL